MQLLRAAVIVLALQACLATPALAHGGGLNAEGCHNDRKRGGYHCHRGAATSPRQPLVPAGVPRRNNLPRDGDLRTPHGAYRNCDAARAAGAAPVLRGEPGYGAHLDRDGDGIGCEPYRGR
ncbi:MAG: excalibur calcium-binding domain-containing protein [Luteimonas sp.]